MNFILLPGNNKSNRLWLTNLAELLELNGHTVVYTAQYSHWDEEPGQMQFDAECEKVAQDVAGLEDYVVIAKSVGSLLAFNLLSNRLLAPQKLIIAGFPLQLLGASEEPMPGELYIESIPIFMSQNDGDPLGTFESVKTFFEQLDLPNYHFTKLEGKTHEYNDFDKLLRLSE